MRLRELGHPERRKLIERQPLTEIVQRGRPDWWGDAVSHLSADPLLGDIVESFAGEGMSGRGDIFQTLVRSIVGQQISVKAADTIHSRLEGLCDEISRESVGYLTIDELESCGLSRQKSLYIRGIATGDEPLLPEGYEEMEDDSLIKHLVKLKGVGPWTAEMMLIFSLMRSDVLSLGDLGVVKGIQRLVPEARSKDEMIAVAEAWRPYRSAACWFLWRSLDPVPVEY
tara:strand:+ start:24 stop:704 length:681 start_codon:yes stop_codon:yes gene_type:complete